MRASGRFRPVGTTGSGSLCPVHGRQARNGAGKPVGGRRGVGGETGGKP